MPRIVTLPSKGRLFVATDLQGNVRDFEAVQEVFLTSLEAGENPNLVITGDLVHGPEIAETDWPDHLGSFYHGDSPALLRRARSLWQAHPERVHFLLGNHEHAHIGGPVVSKFFPDEAGRLEDLLGPGEADGFRDWISGWPLVAIAAEAGLAMMHAAPHAQLKSRDDLERLDLDLRREDIDLEGPALLIPLLWARSTSTERARAFLAALGPELNVAIYGHDVAHAGYMIGREPLLCVSTSFGCHDGDKLYLSWDLSRKAESAAEVARDGLFPLYPDETPVHRNAGRSPPAR